MNVAQCCAYLNSLVRCDHQHNPSIFDFSMSSYTRQPGNYLQNACQHIKSVKSLVPTMLVVLLYVLRFQHRSGITITRFNVYSLILTGVICAEKFYDDDAYDLRHWSEIAQVSGGHLCKMETLLCAANQYRMWITNELVQHMKGYINSLFDRQAARRLKRSQIDSMEVDEVHDEVVDYVSKQTPSDSMKTEVS